MDQGVSATVQLPHFDQEWITNNLPQSQRQWISEAVFNSRDEQELGQLFESPWVDKNREGVVQKVTEITNNDRTFAETLLNVASGIQSC